MANWEVTWQGMQPGGERAWGRGGHPHAVPRHHPLGRRYLWSICSPSRYRTGYAAALACSGSPTPSGGDTGSMQLSDPLPAEALLCSGDLPGAMARCSRVLATSSAQQLGVGGGRRTKTAFLQQGGKKPTPPRPCGLTAPFNVSRRKSAAWAFCTAGVRSRTEPRRGADFQAAGQPAAAPDAAAQEGPDGGTSPGTCWLSPSVPVWEGHQPCGGC